MRHAPPSRHLRAIRASARVALFLCLVTVLTITARWVWAHPNTAFWALLAVLLPATWWGNTWSKQKEKEHARHPH